MASLLFTAAKLFIAVQLVSSQRAYASNVDEPICSSVPHLNRNCLYHSYEVGTSLTLNCAIETDLVDWYMGREGEGELEAVSKTQDTRISITKTTDTSTLSLQILSPKDNGRIFECRAINRDGNFTTFRLHLRQLQSLDGETKPPTILSISNATASLGSAAKLVCNLTLADGEVLQETTWLRGDFKKLMTSPNMDVKTLNQLTPNLVLAYLEMQERSAASNPFELNFNSVTETDYGPYTCYHVTNSSSAAAIVWLSKPTAGTFSRGYLMPLAIGATVTLIGLFTFVVVLTALLCHRRKNVAFKPIADHYEL